MSIHKKRRKIEICHNCHTILNPENNFCPHCGQENHDLKVPIGHLAFEVFEGFTHFDTKFYNTMKAIFLSPGKITKDFLEGRRGRYVPPVRLYFLISFIFFLAMDKMVDNAMNDKDNFLSKIFKGDSAKTIEEVKTANKKELTDNLAESQKEYNDLKKTKDTTGLFEAQEAVKEATQNLKSDKIEKYRQERINRFIDFKSLSANEVMDEMNVDKEDTLRALLKKLPEDSQNKRLIEIQKQIISDTLHSETMDEPSNELRNYFTETIGKKRQLQYTLNLYALKNNGQIKVKYDGDTLIDIKGSDGSLQNTAYKKRILKMSDAELDSVMVKGKGKGQIVNFFGVKFIERGAFRNQIYYDLAFNDDASKAGIEIAHWGIGVFSLMMFFLMPIVAFLLKIIYSKRTHSIISYPFRLYRYVWDRLMFTLKIKKVRRYRHIPHLMAGQTRYYYEHLIFSIHIHAIFFLMILIFVGGGMALGFPKNTLILTMLGFFLYFIISLKTVYRQGILKTLLKSVILFFMYITTFFLVITFVGAFKFALA